MNNDILNDILQAMEDLSKFSTDGSVYWIGEAETVFDRLAWIYLERGGDVDLLESKFQGFFG